jgi:hypothetical protein
MAIDPSTVVKHALYVTKEIYDRLQGCSENDAVCQRLMQQIKKLQNIANDLKELEMDEFPASCRNELDSFGDSLEICRGACNALDRAGTIAKFIKVHGHKSELETLEIQLKRATDNLQLVLNQVSVLQNRRLEEAIHRSKGEVIGSVINPRQGIFLPNSRVDEARPHLIEPPEVSLDDSGDLMEVKWKDERNQKDTIDRYEVRYDEENNLAVHASVDECTLLGNDNTFYMKLGEPKIKVGNLYSVQVRATNGAGPGDWSGPTIFRFKVGPPNKPKKPRAIIQSPTEVMIFASRPSVKDENGSCITCCKVEYVNVDGDDTTWEVLEINVKQRSTPEIKLKIGTLKPDTTYQFRIKMVNENGESPPSDSREVVTTQVTPGPALNLRVSSKRTDKSIKLRWDEPADNPQAAHKYKVQMRMRKEPAWTDCATVEKRSAKLIDLKTDTNYCFRVQSMNNQGHRGKWSVEIEAETRFGVLGRTLGTIGAFVGGTVGGPVLGAVGGGFAAGAAAGKIPDSRTGQRAASIGAGAGGAVAGALLGTLGAPVVGVTTAVLANKKLAGESDDISPQTSDDEDHKPSTWAQMKKMSEQMAEDMLNKK